jgi:hypothetical protein
MRVATDKGRDDVQPVLRVLPIPGTGHAVTGEAVPELVRHRLDDLMGTAPRAMLLVDFKGARVMTDTLIDILTPLARAVRAARHGEFLLVVVASDPGVVQVAEMFAVAQDVPMFVTSSIDEVTRARPVGKLTPAESDSLQWMDRLGGRVTVSGFAKAADLEQTAAGNRLANLSRRGYVQRVPRSRRDGDEYVTPAYYDGGTAAAQLAAT